MNIRTVFGSSGSQFVDKRPGSDVSYQCSQITITLSRDIFAYCKIITSFLVIRASGLSREPTDRQTDRRTWRTIRVPYRLRNLKKPLNSEKTKCTIRATKSQPIIVRLYYSHAVITRRHYPLPPGPPAHTARAYS
ncbi:hypothetical protein EVAR_102721_1 [Eumeta japonica]|uniref:Uncharacterized protein n=1 Tax=Eumeta variegata TaxID=151549 RepID=A0A4C1TKR4_EUMVA|nr:hypothetical protein EVAR_102721_1 [Eumeta japonica]